MKHINSEMVHPSINSGPDERSWSPAARASSAAAWSNSCSRKALSVRVLAHYKPYASAGFLSDHLDDIEMIAEMSVTADKSSMRPRGSTPSSTSRP